MLLLLHARRPAAHSRKYSIHRKSNTRCADEAGASSTASGGSVTERAKYLAAPHWSVLLLVNHPVDSKQHIRLRFWCTHEQPCASLFRESRDVFLPNIIACDDEPAYFCLLSVCDLDSTWLFGIPPCLSAEFSIPTYLPMMMDFFIAMGILRKNSTDIEVVFSYLRHMERTQRFQIEGRNISDCNRSLNLMKFYYHSRLYLRTSINFIVPD